MLFDVTDPSAPQVIDLLALEGPALAVSVRGAIAFEGSRGGMVRSLKLAGVPRGSRLVRRHCTAAPGRWRSRATTLT